MQLVAPLIAGIQGASLGTATLYERGTGTRAAWSTTFEGGTTSTTDVTLDGYGGAEVYVSQLVDVDVKDATGTTIRQFTAGESADNVELISAAFTGSDYATAVTGLGKPLTVRQAMDLWLASAGAPDFKVMLGGVVTLLQNAVAAPQFFNVKDATYGAKGDGATDDGTAIQAAIDAAHAAGGGWVFFPGGIYRIVAALTWPADVSLLGIGAQKSYITLDHATADMFNASANMSDVTFVMGLSFDHQQANTGAIFDLVSLDRYHLFIGCKLGNATTTTGQCIANAGTSSLLEFYTCHVLTKNNGIAVENGRFTACTFALGAVTSGTRILLISTGDLQVSDCRFDMSAAAGATAQCINVGSTNYANISNCRFVNSGSAGTLTSIVSTGSAKTTITGCHFGAFAGTSTGVCVNAGNTGQVTVTGCTFSGTIGTTWTGIVIGGTETMVSEAGNSWEDGAAAKGRPAVVPYSYTLDVTKFGQLQLGSREAFENIATQTGGGTKTLSSDLYGHITVTVTDNTAFTLQLNKAPIGARFVVTVYSSGGGGTGNITWGTNIHGSPATYTVATTKHRVYEFVSSLDGAGTTIEWFQVASTFGDV